MNELKHTPGPWHAEGFRQHESIADCGVVAVPHDGHGYAICRAPRFATKEEWTANAALIAASPDLLAACKLFDQAGQDELDGITRSGGPDIWAELRAAIAKAEGNP